MAAVGVASTSCRCSSVVFVGNIPYQASEKELLDACEEIGPVVSLRVSIDKDTGRPKGFAFCEYLDDETARSACRNLHGHPLRGRALRVGVARHQQQQRGVGDPDAAVGVEDATHAASLVEGSAPSEAVTRYLAGTSRRQLRGLLEVVAREDAGVVERAKRELSGLATLIEQARILVEEDVGVVKACDGGGVAGKRPGGLEEAGPAAKVRKVGDGAVGVVVACR
uniref:Uncharacterized protein n=1 Tax=Avena sativa TaxID=4498 RepID=A0ACD5UII0_AVESA